MLNFDKCCKVLPCNSKKPPAYNNNNYLFLWSWAGGILRILQSDWFRKQAVLSYLLTMGMVTNYAKRRVKLRIFLNSFSYLLKNLEINKNVIHQPCRSVLGKTLLYLRPQAQFFSIWTSRPVNNIIIIIYFRVIIWVLVILG